MEERKGQYQRVANHCGVASDDEKGEVRNQTKKREGLYLLVGMAVGERILVRVDQLA